MILVVSLGLVIVAFVAIFAFHAPSAVTRQGDGGQAGVKGAAAKSFHTPAAPEAKQTAPTDAATPGTH